MIKKLLFSCLFFISMAGFGQLSPSGVTRIQDSTTIFTDNLSNGWILMLLETDRSYKIINAIDGSDTTFAQLVKGVDYEDFVSDGGVTGDGTTGKVARFSGANSIEDGGITDNSNANALTIDVNENLIPSTTRFGTAEGSYNFDLGDGNYTAKTGELYTSTVGSDNGSSATGIVGYNNIVGSGNFDLFLDNLFYLNITGYNNFGGAAGSDAARLIIAGDSTAYSCADDIFNSIFAGNSNLKNITGEVSAGISIGAANGYTATGEAISFMMIGDSIATEASGVNHLIAAGERVFGTSTHSLDSAIGIGYKAGYGTSYSAPAIFGAYGQPTADNQVVIGSSFYTSGILLDGDVTISTVANSTGDFLTAPTSGGLISQRTSAQVLSDIGGESALTFSTGLTRATNTITTDLSTGKAGGQTVIGGTGTTDDLSFKTTTGAGTTGADMHFAVGNNGATEAMTILNNGNVGIGTISPVKKFDVIETTSDVAGEMRIGGILAGDNLPFGTINFANTAAANSQTNKILASISGFKIGSSNSGSLVFNTSTSSSPTEKLRIANNGNVGIGTTTPSEKLEVNGDIIGDTLFTTVAASLENATNYVVGGDSTKAYIDREVSGAGGGTVTSVAAGNGLDFTTITSSGSVTLGTPTGITGTSTNSVTTTSHTHAITDAVANGSTQGVASFTANDFNATAGNISIDYTNGTKATNAVPGFATAAHITAIEANTAKVTNATHTGDVTGATALTIGSDKILEGMLKSVNAPTDEYFLTYESTTGDFEWQSSGASENWTLDNDTLSAGAYILSINETAPDADKGGLTLNHGTSFGNIFTIKSSQVNHGLTDIAETDTYGFFQRESDAGGGLLIGGISEAQIGVYLDATTIQTDGGSTTTATGGITMNVSADSGTGKGDYSDTGNLLSIRNNSTTRYFFKGDGTAYADVAWSTFSDSRLKKNKIALPYGLDEIMKLNPVKYDRYSGSLDNGKIKLDKCSKREEIGLVAQELIEVIPEAVQKPEDESNSFYGVDYVRLIPVLIKAVQEQQEQIEDLKREIESLKYNPKKSNRFTETFKNIGK